MNILTLAYLGDSIYELIIRKYLIDKGIIKVNNLQKEAINYVSAKSQAKFMNYLLENNLLTDDEINIYLRGRNHQNNHKPKNTDIITYKIATGFEAILGHLYINNNLKRINELMDIIYQLKEE